MPRSPHGWKKERAVPARFLMRMGPHLIAPDSGPLPAAAYIPRHRSLDQAQAGTCYAHGPVGSIEDAEKLRRAKTILEVSRRFAAWAGTELGNPGANPSDGGSPTDVFTAMTSKGPGVCLESLLEYSDDYKVLGTRPPEAVFTAAGAHHFGQLPVDVTNWNGMLQMLGRHTGSVVLGSLWPEAWGDPPFLKPAQQVVTEDDGGHCYRAVGYFTYQGTQWIILRNSWGPSVYNLPPQNVIDILTPLDWTAADPDGALTDEFAVPLNVLAHVHQDFTEKVAMTSLVGLDEQFAFIDPNRPGTAGLEGLV